MIRLAATLLIAAQALLPPGMCPCQIASFAAATRPVHETAPARIVAAGESCCSCPACRSAAPAAHAPADAPAATCRQAPPEHKPAAPAPCSGCPVVSAGPVARAAVLTAPEQAALDPALSAAIPTVEVVPPLATRPTLLVPPAARPLFVRHCTFLI